MGDIFVELLEDQIFIPTDSLLSPEQLQYKYIIKAKIKTASEKPKKDKKSVNKPEKQNKNITPPNFAKLIGIVSGSFNFEQAHNSIVSIQEKKLRKLITKHSCEKIIHYHSKFLSRIYPKGDRITSSNFNPMRYWIHGSQLVAINYQGSDVGVLLNAS